MTGNLEKRCRGENPFTTLLVYSLSNRISLYPQFFFECRDMQRRYKERLDEP